MHLEYQMGARMIISSLVGGRDDGEIEATGGGRCKKAKKQAMITWADDDDTHIKCNKMRCYTCS